MLEDTKKIVLAALCGYGTIKRIIRSGQPIDSLVAQINSIILSGEQLLSAAKTVEDTLLYFYLKDESQGQFIEFYFFKRMGWVEITHKIGISYCTVQNWRREAIKIATRAARRNGLL